jgi:hypothetical protein
MRRSQGRQIIVAIEDALKNSAGMFPDATRQNKTGATREGCAG